MLGLRLWGAIGSGAWRGAYLGVGGGRPLRGSATSAEPGPASSASDSPVFATGRSLIWSCGILLMDDLLPLLEVKVGKLNYYKPKQRTFQLFPDSPLGESWEEPNGFVPQVKH